MRSQGASDSEKAAWSDEAAISFDPVEDRARQEFKDESDINVILRKANAGGFEPRPVQYGVQDFDWDLQGLYESQRIAAEAWQRLPEGLRARYKGWEELLPALERGDVTLADPDGVVIEKPVVDEVDPVPPVAP